MVILTTALAVLLTGSLVYCVLVVAAARRFLSATLPAPGCKPPVSVLKPLCGHDDGLEENLRSFFVQDYPEYEVVFGVHRQDDPAVAVAEKIISEFSVRISARLIVTGESPIPNAKAFSLNRMVREARYDVLVMSASDVRVTPGLLSHLAREFQNERIGLISCPYRAVPGKSLWSRLEAIGMNAELLSGVLVARMIEGMKFALGCTVAVRRSVLDAMGGFAYLQEFLAEDFVIGHRAAEMGHGVLLSSCVIEHRIGSQGMLHNLSHRLRWTRSTRRSRPAGYWGQIFTYPLPLALRSEEHTSELESRQYLVCRLLLEKKKNKPTHCYYERTNDQRTSTDHARWNLTPNTLARMAAPAITSSTTLMAKKPSSRYSKDIR